MSNNSNRSNEIVPCWSPFQFDPSVRSFCLNHSRPVTMGDPEEIPEEFRGTPLPVVGPDALCHATSNPSVAELELLRPFIPGLVLLCFRVPELSGRWQPASQVGYERMWVSVDECEGRW